MKKITDRFLLGVVSGLGGNLAKMAIEAVFKPFGFKQTGIMKASGIFVKKSDMNKPMGKAVGFIADNMVAAGLGITCVYWLTLMGKDHKILKGAGLGAMEWAALYGVMSKMGATSIYPSPPLDAIVSFLSHVAFGATKISIITALGDDRLFHPKNLSLEIEDPQDLKMPTLNSAKKKVIAIQHRIKQENKVYNDAP